MAGDDMAKMMQIMLLATGQTLIMVFFSSLFSVILGLPLGVLLYTTDETTGLYVHKILNKILQAFVNVVRSIPFIILVILIFPFTRLVVGSAIGTTASIVPLTLAAAPFLARVIETALKDISPDIILCAKSMGSTNMQIIYKVLLPEALPAIVDGITLAVINLIAYSAMAGVVGGGGLGDVAVRYGYHRYQVEYMLFSVAVILLLVAVVQFIGTKISNTLIAKR